MNIRTKSVDYKITPDITSYLEERVAALGKFLGKDARVEVELGRDAGRPRHGKNIFFAEFIVKQPGSERLCSRNNSESINGAIDDAKDEIVRQLRSAKSLHKRSDRKAGAMVKKALHQERES